MKRALLDDTDLVGYGPAQIEESGFDPLDPFFASGEIIDVIGELKSGKEGTVYVCRANPSTDHELLAAKVYRSRQHRSFQNDAVYLEGRSFGKRRENLAVKSKTRKGREIQFGAWLRNEWSLLSQLHAAGAPVPRPVSLSESAILMEYIGDSSDAAPLLHGVRPEPDQVRPLFRQALDGIELLLRSNVVHGDLSPYNILYWHGKLLFIDFPQAVDPRSNTGAQELLARDLERVCAYFMRLGMQVDPVRIARHMWGRFLRMDL